MIFNEHGKISMDFLCKITNAFYMCTGYRIGFQPNQTLMDYDFLQSQREINFVSVMADLREPYENYLNSNISRISSLSLKEKSVNTALSTFLPFNDIIITYTVFHRNEFKGTLYLGPFRINNITTTQIEQLSVLNPEVDAFKIKQYLESMPFINAAQITSLIYLLKIVTQTEADSDDNFISYRENNLAVNPFSFESISPAKHHSYYKEEKLIKELLQSDYSIDDLVKKNLGYVPFIPLSRSDVLRSERNRLIIMSALICRGAINLGVPSETAFSYADFFVIRLEETKTMKEIQSLFLEMVTFYRQETKNAKAINKYSKFTRSIINYIDSHIEQNLNLISITDHFGYNYKYISKLFREETGMTFIDYVYQKKIKLAKDLLITQNYKIEDIAYYLGFSEPYYFTRVFKRYTAMTPNEYRKNNIRT